MSPRPAKNAPSRLNSFDVIMGADSVQSLQHSISKLSVKPTEVKVDPSGQEEGTTAEGEEGGGGGVAASLSEEVFSTPEPGNGDPTFPNQEEVSVNVAGNHESEPNEMEPISQQDIQTLAPKSTSVTELLASNLDDFSVNAQRFVPPDVVESNTIPQSAQQATSEVDGSGVSQSVLPSILEDLTPQNFSIKDEEKQKTKKFTKEDFDNRKNNLGAPEGGLGDPFNSLDPLWSMKGPTEK